VGGWGGRGGVGGGGWGGRVLAGAVWRGQPPPPPRAEAHPRDAQVARSRQDSSRLRAEIVSPDSDIKKKNIAKRLKMSSVPAIRTSRNDDPIAVPVIHSGFAPRVPLDGAASPPPPQLILSPPPPPGGWGSSTQQSFEALIEPRAPDIIILTESRMLPEAVDALFDNGRRGASSPVLINAAESLAVAQWHQGASVRDLLVRAWITPDLGDCGRPRLKLHPVPGCREEALERLYTAVHICPRLTHKGLSTTVKGRPELVEKDKARSLGHPRRCHFASTPCCSTARRRSTVFGLRHSSRC